MFSRRFRLPGHKILSLIKSRQVFFSPLFTLKINFRSNTVSQVGTIVSTKISKKAVIRNRLRRLIREAIKPHLIKLAPTAELLFIAKPQIITKKLPDIQTDILCLLQKAQLLK